MNPPDDLRSQQKLEESVERQVRRMKQAKRERRTLIGQSVYLGTVGILFVLPVIAGAYLGRWLDSLTPDYQVRWTVSMIFLGIVVGAVNVYFFIRE